MAEVEILNPFNEKEYADDKLSVVDVKARDKSGRQFVVEMQMVARTHHRERVLYYATRLYGSQLVEGEKFDALRPVYTISIVNSRVVSDRPAFHTRYVLHDAGHDLTFTDDFVVHMIELQKFGTAIAEVDDELDIWCYFLRHADTLDLAALPAPLARPTVRKAMETLKMISEVERERIRYEDRVKRDRDHLVAMDELAQLAQLRREVEDGQRRLAEQQQRAADEAGTDSPSNSGPPTSSSGPPTSSSGPPTSSRGPTSSSGPPTRRSGESKRVSGNLGRSTHTGCPDGRAKARGKAAESRPHRPRPPPSEPSTD